MREKYSRRRVVFGTGLAVTGVFGGIALGSDNATATVNADFSVPDAEQTLADTSLQDIRLKADTEWSYTANAPIHATELELHVGDSADTLDIVARQTKDNLSKESLTGSTTLEGSLMSASAFSIEDFQPTNGGVSRTVTAELRFYAVRDGEAVADATAQATFEITVTDEELSVDMTMTATGDVTFATTDA